MHSGRGLVSLAWYRRLCRGSLARPSWALRLGHVEDHTTRFERTITSFLGCHGATSRCSDCAATTHDVDPAIRRDRDRARRSGGPDATKPVDTCRLEPCTGAQSRFWQGSLICHRVDRGPAPLVAGRHLATPDLRLHRGPSALLRRAVKLPEKSAEFIGGRAKRGIRTEGFMMKLRRRALIGKSARALRQRVLRGLCRRRASEEAATRFKPETCEAVGLYTGAGRESRRCLRPDWTGSLPQTWASAEAAPISNGRYSWLRQFEAWRGRGLSDIRQEPQAR